MKKIVILVLILFCPVIANAHPGKTDRHGGHKCIKGCEEWGLFYAEYHLHDKFGKPIRIGAKMNAVRPAVKSSDTETTIVPPVATTQTITVCRTLTTVQEEDIITSNPLLWALIVLLLLFLILRRTRREPQKP